MSSFLAFRLLETQQAWREEGKSVVSILTGDPLASRSAWAASLGGERPVLSCSPDSATQVLRSWCARVFGIAALSRLPSGEEKLAATIAERCAIELRKETPAIFTTAFSNDQLTHRFAILHRIAKYLPWLPTAILSSIEVTDELMLPHALETELQRALLHGLVRPDQGLSLTDEEEKKPDHAHLRSDTERAVYYYLRLHPEMRDQVKPNYRLPDPIGNRTAEVDFYFSRSRFVVEIDGPEHASGQRKQLDDQRDRALTKRGFEVKRFSNQAVRENLTEILHRILETHRQRCGLDF